PLRPPASPRASPQARPRRPRGRSGPWRPRSSPRRRVRIAAGNGGGLGPASAGARELAVYQETGMNRVRLVWAVCLALAMTGLSCVTPANDADTARKARPRTHLDRYVHAPDDAYTYTL